MKKEKLKNITKVVEEILRNDELARRDDAYLILKVVEHFYPGETGKTFAEVMFTATEKEISFESITRARRKVQENYPELTDKEVASNRNAEQKEYKEYARR